MVKFALAVLAAAGGAVGAFVCGPEARVDPGDSCNSVCRIECGAVTGRHCAQDSTTAYCDCSSSVPFYANCASGQFYDPISMSCGFSEMNNLEHCEGNLGFDTQADGDDDDLEEEELTLEDFMDDPEVALAGRNLDCRGDGSMTLVIEMEAGVTALNFEAGTCTPKVTQDDQQLQFTVNPRECGYKQKVDLLSYSSYGSNLTIRFDLAVTDKGMNLVFGSYSFEARCGFEDSYQVSTVEEGYDGTSQFIDEAIGGIANDGLLFNITLYSDNTFTDTRTAFPQEAGSWLHYGIKPYEGLKTYDPATMVFAPIDCVFEEKATDLSYTMFKLNPLSDAKGQCDNNLISLDADYNETADEWRFSHILFLFRGDKGHYNLKCNVAVCDKAETGNTRCNFAKGECGIAVQAGPGW